MGVFAARNPEYAAAVRVEFEKQGPLVAWGARIDEVAVGLCRVVLDFHAGVAQHHGYFHGGVIGAVADSAAGFAAFTCQAEGTSVITVEYKINFLAPARGERLVAEGRLIKAGRTLSVAQAEVSVDGVVCALMQQTVMAIAPR